MNMKQFSPVLTVLIVATTPIHGAQQSFLQKWIVEPSQSMIKSPKTWAFTAGAVLCYAAYKGYKKVLQTPKAVLEAKELIKNHYCIISKKDVPQWSKKAIQDYIITHTFIAGKMSPQMCICKDVGTPSERLSKILNIRIQLLDKLIKKLEKVNSGVRIWHQTDLLKRGLLTLKRDARELCNTIDNEDMQQAINECQYMGTPENKKCTSIYCLNMHKKRYSNQS